MADMYRFGSKKVQEQFNHLKAAYVNVITKNPDAFDQVEKTVKAATYILELLTTNCESSFVITEFVTSTCNLFTYANSYFLLKSKRRLASIEDGYIVERIKQVLSVMQLLQAFIEIAAQKVGGSTARWIVIVLICTIKTMLRWLLIFAFETGIQSHSFTSLIKASKLISSTACEDSHNADEEPEVIYIGNSSGHKRRTLHSLSLDPEWSSSKINHNLFANLPPTPLDKTEKIAEFLHATRPLAHVLASSAFGTKSIFPWLIALVMDSSSHVLLQRPPTSSTYTRAQYNTNELNELRRRYAKLLLYLLRSPVYDRFVKSKLLFALTFLSDAVPFSRYLFKPLRKYIPAWQEIYFYNWSD